MLCALFIVQFKKSKQKAGLLFLLEHKSKIAIGYRDSKWRKFKKSMQQERQQVVLNMLKKGFDYSVIAEVTGLSQKEIKKFKNNC